MPLWCVCVSVCPHFCVSGCHLYLAVCLDVPFSVCPCVCVSVHPHFYTPECLFVPTCPHFYPAASARPHFCLYVPISVSMSPFLSACPHFHPSMGLHGSPTEPHLGFIHPPPPKISRLQPIPAHNPHPNPPPALLCISYGSPIDLDPRLGNVWGFAVGFPAPICIQRSQQPPPPHLPPICPPFSPIVPMLDAVIPAPNPQRCSAGRIPARCHPADEGRRDGMGRGGHKAKERGEGGRDRRRAEPYLRAGGGTPHPAPSPKAKG